MSDCYINGIDVDEVLKGAAPYEWVSIGGVQVMNVPERQDYEDAAFDLVWPLIGGTSYQPSRAVRATMYDEAAEAWGEQLPAAVAFIGVRLGLCAEGEAWGDDLADAVRQAVIDDPVAVAWKLDGVAHGEEG